MTARRRIRIPAPVVDWGVVVLFLALVLPEMASNAHFADHRAFALVGGAALIVPFGFRRRRPVGALLVAWSSCALVSVGVASLFYLQTPFPLTLYSAWIAGTTPRLRGALTGLAAVLAALVAVNETYPDAVTGDYLFPGGFILAMWAGSRALHNRGLLAAELHEAAAAAADRREEAAARAIVEERRRIAREMHDLVGHSISVMVVQAGGARRILDRDPDRAVEAAVRIEATGREALAEMRRLLGLLGGRGDGTAYDPQPTLDDLEALVARAHDAGLPVRLAVEGERRPLPAGAEVAVYRVVQESLTNALKHAGGATTEVRLAWGDEALEIVVADRGDHATADPVLPSGGHGIVGMRERVKVYGGELSTGPGPDGGFVVRGVIPYEQEVQAA